jgi:hypothetical protein
MMAGEIELAQKFDTNLEQDGLGGMFRALMVHFTSNL